MNTQSNDVFANCPDGTTHFMPQTTGCMQCWVKQENHKFYYCFMDNNQWRAWPAAFQFEQYFVHRKQKPKIDMIMDPWYIVIKSDSHFYEVRAWLKSVYKLDLKLRDSKTPKILTNRYSCGGFDGCLKYASSVEGVFPSCVELDVEIDVKPKRVEIKNSIKSQQIAELEKVIADAESRIRTLSSPQC